MEGHCNGASAPHIEIGLSGITVESCTRYPDGYKAT
jgi:hypothetical protein